MLLIADFDSLIKQHAPTIGTDWRLFKAQLHQESSLRRHAVSSAGALGIAQFMPDTWTWARKSMGKPGTGDPMEPADAIPTAAWYMCHLLRQWNAPRPAIDRYMLALASYNAGIGNLTKAQDEAGGANDFASIIVNLSHITGYHARETRDYVKRIYDIYLNQVRGY